MVNRSRETRRQNAAYRAYALLRFAIKSGGLPRGFSMDEHSIMSHLEFSRAAIRDALRQLGQDGLVSRRVRVGTIIEKESVPFALADIVPRRPDQVMTYRCIDKYALSGSDYLSSKLGLADAGVLMSEFELLLESTTIGILTVFSANPNTGSLLESAAEMHTLVEEFPLQYGVEFGGVDVSIDARVADAEVAHLLGVQEGDALLVREQVFRDVDGVVWEYGFAQYRSDLVIFTSSAGPSAAQRPRPTAWQSDFNSSTRALR